MWILKVLAFLWPFIKEMVLGDKTLKEAIQDNKKKVAFAIFVLCSVGFNFFLMVRLVAISQKYLELEKLHPTTAVVEPHAHAAPVPTALKPKPRVPDPVADVPAEVDVPVTPETPVRPVRHRPPTKAVVPKPTKKPLGPPATNEDRYSRMKESFDKIKEREEKAGF